MLKATLVILIGSWIWNSAYAVRSPKYKYKPDWDDLDKRPLPEWYDEAKIGVFIHWGLYSVPGYGSEWFWNNWANKEDKYVKFMKKNYPPDFRYADFAPQFKAEFFDPEHWADLFQKAGMKYVVLTSKHHEGYTMFPSARSWNWNSVETGPHRDVVGELAASVRARALRYGLYHSLYEWFNPLYLADKAALFRREQYVRAKLQPELRQLVQAYRPDVLWADGDWEAPATYWGSTDFLAWLYSDSAVRDSVVVNDRWGIGTACRHGDFYNCEDNYRPGKLMQHKWESAFSLDRRSWGHRRDLHAGDLLTARELVAQVASTVSCGGNALINVGPSAEGVVPAAQEALLLQLGAWLARCGDAVYGTRPWRHQNDTAFAEPEPEPARTAWYTARLHRPTSPTSPTQQDRDQVEAVYAIFFDWPTDGALKLRKISEFLSSANAQETVHAVLLGHEGHELQWAVSEGVTTVQLPCAGGAGGAAAWAVRFSARLGPAPAPAPAPAPPPPAPPTSSLVLNLTSN